MEETSHFLSGFKTFFHRMGLMAGIENMAKNL